MKRCTLLVFFTLLSVFCFAQNQTNDCTKLKNGNFKYLEDSTNTVVYVTRTRKRQKEVNPTTGLVIVFKLRWVEDCTYQLTQEWTNSKAESKYDNKATVIKITKVYDDKYEYTCGCKDGTSLNVGGTMFMIK